MFSNLGSNWGGFEILSVWWNMTEYHGDDQTVKAFNTHTRRIREQKRVRIGLRMERINLVKEILMFKSYFKIAWRSLRHNITSSFINIGLAVGMTVAILLGLWIYNELSFDKYHKNHERVAR